MFAHRVATITLVIAAAWPVAVAARPPIIRHRTVIGSWRLDVNRDSFSGAVACRLRGPNGAFYQGGAIGFQFGHRQNVTQAVYRIDRGEPRLSRDDLPELTELGTPLDIGPMTNPQGGVVHIPWRLLRSATSIAIQPAPGRRPRTFHLGGVRGLRDLALARGCMPDARFVR